MPTLPDSLIQKFAKVANEPPRDEKDVIVYGTVSISGDGTEEQEINVTLDGSEAATPVTSTCVVKDGDRVTVLIKNHKAVITGNITKPSATDVDLQDAKEDIADVATTVSGFSDDIEAASTAANRAARLAQDSLTAANGKSRNFYTTDPPDPDDYDYEFQEGDTWYDTDGGYLMHDWNPTTLQWDPKPLDSQAIAVGAIKAANIDAGAVTADKVAAKTITVDKLAVGDTTNLITVNERIAGSMCNIAGRETQQISQTISGIKYYYVAKKVATNEYIGLVSNAYHPATFHNGDEFFFSFYGKATVAGTLYLSVLGFDADGKQITNAKHSTTQGTDVSNVFAFTTSEKYFTGIVKLKGPTGDTHDYWGDATYYRIAIKDTRSSKSQIYVRDAKFMRRANADLLVNGSITAEKINGNTLEGTSVTGGMLSTKKGDRLRMRYYPSTGEFDYDPRGSISNDSKIEISNSGIIDYDGYDGIANQILSAYVQNQGTLVSLDMLLIGPNVHIPNLITGKVGETLGGEVYSYLKTKKQLALERGNAATGLSGITGVVWGAISTIYLGGFSYNGMASTPQQLNNKFWPAVTQDLVDTNYGYRFYIYGLNDDGNAYKVDGVTKFTKRPGMIFCPSMDGQSTKTSLRGTFTYINGYNASGGAEWAEAES